MRYKIIAIGVMIFSIYMIGKLSNNSDVTKVVYFQNDESKKHEYEAMNDCGRQSKIERLNKDTQKKAYDLLRAARSAGLQVSVFETTRSLCRQKHYVRKGTSWTYASSHLVGNAFDITFLNPDGTPSWDQSHDWQALGELGRSVGLKWGGDWRVKDMVHFYLE